MAGIISYGAYVPIYCLSRDLIAQAWGSASLGGVKAVASYDEDTITMAIEAGFDCLGDADPRQLDALYFASTTAPYKEKQSSSLIATVLDLRQDILTSDFSNSLRSGASAFAAALNAIGNKSARRVLITVADARLGAPESDSEQIFADGAAAFLLGDSEVVANITGSYAISDDFIDYWRTDQDTFTKSSEERFINVYGYMNNVQEAGTGIMKKYSLVPADFSKIVLYAPNPRQHVAMAKRLGFDVKKQLSDLLFDKIGNTGAALSPMMLVAALEESKPGDKLLFICYGDGSQAFIIEVTGEIGKMKGRGLKNYLGSKVMIDSYAKYLRIRNIIAREATRRPPSGSSLPILWRQKKSLLSLYGSKCNRCGLIQHPVQRVCYNCGSVDEYEEVKLAKRGTIFSYTEDYIALSPQLPQGLAVVDLNDGSRIYVQLIEAEAQKAHDRPMKIGMSIEMTLRRMGEDGGFYSYYWKAKPLRRKVE